MSTENSLLKEAIADARAVRATAIANARLALQEHFDSKITGVLAEKLKSELAEDDVAAPVEAPAAPVDTADEIEFEDASSEEVAPAPTEAPVAAVETQPEQAPVAPAAPVEAPVATQDDVTDDEITELLKELNDSADDEVDLDGAVADVKESSADVSDEDVAAAKETVNADEFVGKDAKAVAPVDDDEIVNLEELISELSDEGSESAEHEASETPEEEAAEHLQEKIKNLEAENAALNEGIKSLRGTINEMNLLNAKLLYTNKLFQKGALNESQKMKIVESMDRTTSVREVKLIYTTLSESLSFSAKKPVIPSSPMKKVAVSTITEGLASKPVSSTKPSKEILTEATIMAARFQKLAGITKG